MLVPFANVSPIPTNFNFDFSVHVKNSFSQKPDFLFL